MVNVKHLISDSLLLKRASLGDRDAFCALYDRYRPKVYSYPLKITQSVEMAEDIAHDLLVKLWDNGGMEVENVEGFLRVVTRNHTLKVLRRQVLENRTVADIGKRQPLCDSCTDDAIAYNETQEIVFIAISRMSPQRKQVFLLCREEGLKYDEVAERMNLSPLTVKTPMQHALRFLRNYVSKYPAILLLLINRFL